MKSVRKWMVLIMVALALIVGGCGGSSGSGGTGGSGSATGAIEGSGN